LPQRPAAQEPIPQLASSSAGLPAALALPPDVSDALHCLAGQRPRVHSPGALAGTERKALESLDQTLALPTLPEDLLPRAAALILSLLALLRQTDLPVPALAERVSWDVLLTAEVLRVVSSPYDRAQGALTSLAQAIPLTGIQGRQAVFARVVLKPMCKAPPGPLSAHAASRLWDHAEALARHSARLGGQAGCRCPMAARPACCTAVAGPSRCACSTALDSRHPCTAGDFCRRMRGARAQALRAAAPRWNIAPGFQSVAVDARDPALHSSSHPLMMALRQAQPRAMADLAHWTRAEARAFIE